MMVIMSSAFRYRYTDELLHFCEIFFYCQYKYLVDVGLLEIVTSPDLTGVDDTISFVKELRMMLQYLDTCDGKMQGVFT